MFKIDVDLKTASFKEILEFLCPRENVKDAKNTCMTQDLSEEELTQLVFRLENLFFIKHKSKLINLTLTMVLLSMGSVLLGMFEPFFLGLGLLGVLCTVVAVLVQGVLESWIQVRCAHRLLTVLKPMADNPDLCTYALQICETSKFAQSYRELVIASGRQFRHFDYGRMTVLRDQEILHMNETAGLNSCKILHGLPTS